MQLPGEIILFIAIANGLVGLMFLYLPDYIRPFESWINSPVGNREMSALHLGQQGVRLVDQFMNRVVLSRQIIWDDWLVEHPRLFGMTLCALAIWLFSVAQASA